MSFVNRIAKLEQLAGNLLRSIPRPRRWWAKPPFEKQDSLPPDATDQDRVDFETIRAMDESIVGPEAAARCWPE